jgi:hypothetical protein
VMVSTPTNHIDTTPASEAAVTGSPWQRVELSRPAFLATGIAAWAAARCGRSRAASPLRYPPRPLNDSRLPWTNSRGPVMNASARSLVG